MMIKLKKESLYFSDYGKLEWLDPDDYYTGRWVYVGYAEGSDGETYDLIRHEYEMEMRYTHV